MVMEESMVAEHDMPNSRKETDWHEQNAEKVRQVMAMIKPLCELFHIDDYGYYINERSDDGFYTDEWLELDGQRIGCSGNSVESSFYEAVGYVIINRYCKRRSLGAFENQTKNYIKRYWR